MAGGRDDRRSDLAASTWSGLRFAPASPEAGLYRSGSNSILGFCDQGRARVPDSEDGVKETSEMPAMIVGGLLCVVSLAGLFFSPRRGLLEGLLGLGAIVFVAGLLGYIKSRIRI